MSKSRLMLVFIWAFLAGVLLADFVWNGDFGKVLAILTFYCGILWVWQARGEDGVTVGRWASPMGIIFNRKFVVVMICGLVIGFLRLIWAVWGFGDGVEKYLGKADLRACVSEEVDVRVDKVKYVVKLMDENAVKILVDGARYPVYRYGDCLEISGKLEKPKPFQGFDYENYLARYGIQAVMSFVKVKKLPEKVDSFGGWFFGGLYSLKDVVEKRLAKTFAEPGASLMAGLLLGSRSGVDAGLMKDFNTTGLSHILAVSGYNITMVVGIVNGFLGCFTRRKRVVVAVIFILVFVLLVGASAAVVRAGIMGFIALLALWFGRQYLAVLGLWLAVFFMNFWNPMMMLYDVGFQLSFLATAGLIYVSPVLKERVLWLPERFGLRDSVLMTVSAQVLALPIILLSFGRLSLISVLANVLVGPLVPLAMLWGFLAIVLGFFGDFFGVFVGFVGNLVIGLLVFVVETLARVPLAAVEIGWFYWWVGLIYYFAILAWLTRKSV